MNKLLNCLFLFIIITNVKSEIREKRQCRKPVTTVSGAAARQVSCAGELIFEDNFDFLNLNKWQHEISLFGGWNNEFQWYVNDRNNTFTRDGSLHIKPTLTSDFLGGENKLYSDTIDLGSSCTNGAVNGCKRTGTSTDVLNPIRSGLLKTIRTFAFKYGRVQIRAKLPAGDWLWPAIWFLPRDSVYGSSPRSGEIDLVESRGNRNFQAWNMNIGTDYVASTLHWGPDQAHNGFQKTVYELYKTGQGFNNDFHIYEFTWTPNNIKISVDGKELGTADPVTNFWDYGEFAKQGLTDNPWQGRGKMAPFDQEFYIILNLAVGGTSGYFPDSGRNYPTPKPWLNTAPHAMTDFWKKSNEWLPTWKLWENNAYEASLKIDYVKVWAV